MGSCLSAALAALSAEDLPELYQVNELVKSLGRDDAIGSAAAYPNQLDYSGHVSKSPVALEIQSFQIHSQILPPGIEPGTFRV